KLDEATADKLARRGERGESDDRGGDDKTALGVSVAPLTPETADRLRVPKGTQGLVIEDVTPDGRAAAAGMQPGDIIVEANRRPGKTGEGLGAAKRGAA